MDDKHNLNCEQHQDTESTPLDLTAGKTYHVVVERRTVRKSRRELCAARGPTQVPKPRVHFRRPQGREVSTK